MMWAVWSMKFHGYPDKQVAATLGIRAEYVQQLWCIARVRALEAQR